MIYTDLHEVAERFRGVILFDGEGSVSIMETNETFNFDTLSCKDYDKENVTFTEMNHVVNLESFTFDELPYNVKDTDVVEASIIRDLKSLTKIQRQNLLNKLKELK